MAETLEICAWNAAVAEQVEDDQAAHTWRLLSILLESERDQGKATLSGLIIPSRSETMETMNSSARPSSGIVVVGEKQGGRVPSSAKSAPDRTEYTDTTAAAAAPNKPSNSGLSGLRGFQPIEPSPSAPPVANPKSKEDSSGTEGTVTGANMSNQHTQHRVLSSNQVDEIRNKLLSPKAFPEEQLYSPPAEEEDDSDTDDDDDALRLSTSILASTLTLKGPRPNHSGTTDHDDLDHGLQLTDLEARRSSGLSIAKQSKRRLAGKAGLRLANQRPAEQKAVLGKWNQTVRTTLRSLFDYALSEVSRTWHARLQC